MTTKREDPSPAGDSERRWLDVEDVLDLSAVGPACIVVGPLRRAGARSQDRSNSSSSSPAVTILCEADVDCTDWRAVDDEVVSCAERQGPSHLMHVPRNDGVSGADDADDHRAPPAERDSVSAPSSHLASQRDLQRRAVPPSGGV